MNEFQSPSIDYAAVSPLLIVFGVAIAGVLVEAFAPRRVRYVVQSVLTLAGLAVAFAATVWVATDLTERAGRRSLRLRRGRGGHRRRRSLGVPVGHAAPAVVRQRDALRRASPRRRADGVRRPGGGTAGHRGRASGLHQGPGAHGGLPADDLRGRRHDALRLLQRPADDVRRARGLLAAALPPLRSGATSPAAEPGGGDEVLPARRLQLRLLPLRHRAGLRLRRHHEPGRDRRGGGGPHRCGRAAARRHRR